VLSLAKFRAVLFVFVGLVAGIFYSFGGVIVDVLFIGLIFGTALPFFAIIGMPITFAPFGFIIGLFEAFLYNIFARKYGGIEIDFER